MRWGLAGIAGRGAALAAILVLVGCGDPAAPIVTTAELRIQQIYDASEWLQRVPVEYAAAFYVRSKVESFIDDLDLPDEIRTRVSERLDAEDFVDELIPFVLFLRDMYLEPEGKGAEDFDGYLREHFAPEDEVPGITHDMFEWDPAESESDGAALPGLPPSIARQLVTLYDSLYLRDRPPASSVDERLACDSREAGPALETATRAAMPSIRALLVVLRDQMSGAAESGTESELADGLQGLLDDNSKLEAASAAVVRFVDQTVCRNYRFFASRAFRARQLERWMHRELDAPAGGLLWEYLEYASHERRYGALIVVDGLQGRLMEALAGGTADSPFIQAVVAEQAAGGGPAPKARSLRSPDAQQTRFLTHFARQGFQHSHYLPFFKGLLLGPRAAWVPVGVSTTPTISVRNIPISLTGAAVAGPHGTGLPNFHFVDRGYTRAGKQRGRAYYFYGSDAVELVSLTRHAGMRTLAERLPHLSSMSCTAQYDESFHFGYDALLNLGLGERIRDFGDRLCAADLMRRARTERDLDRLRRELLGRRESIVARHGWWELWQHYGQSKERDLMRIRLTEIARLEQRAMPELFVYYNPWPDHFAHFEGPFADEIISPSGELNRLDYWLSRVQHAYEQARVKERTLFGMAGDHGLSPVFHLLNPEVEVFDALREEGFDLRVVKISSDEGEGPKLTNPFDPPTMKGIDVVVASTAGGNYMLDLFLDQDAHFTVQPLAEDLRAVRPLGAARGTRAVDLLDEITRRLADSLDYLVVREAPCDPERCRVRVMAVRGGAPASGSIRREGTRVHYAFEGADLLDIDRASPYETMSDVKASAHAMLRSRCLDAPVDDLSRWCEEADWRRLTSFTSRPDSVVQLAHLYDASHAGTVNLFPRNGVGYNSRVPGRHAGESFHEKNAFVALWGPGFLSGAEVPRSAEGGSVPMAIFEWLSGTRPVRGQDGWGFARLEGILSRSN